MGVEEGPQLHKTEEAYLRKASKTPGVFDYGAQTPSVHKSQDALEAVDRRAKEAFPHDCFPQQPGRTGHENKGVTPSRHLRSQSAENWRMKGEKDASCRMNNEHMQKLRDKIKRDRWLSAIQDYCTHGRTVSILCHPANTGNLSENCNPSLSIWEKMTGFYHCKPLHSWTKIYASKARISKIWALFNLELTKQRVNRKHLPTHSLQYDLKYVHFVTNGSPIMSYQTTAPTPHLIYDCRTALLPPLQLKHNSWCRCLWYGHK